MAERTIALVLKTSGPQGPAGSNPAPSATQPPPARRSSSPTGAWPSPGWCGRAARAPGGSGWTAGASRRPRSVKHGLGRLDLPEPPARSVPSRVEAIGATPVAFEHPHALGVAALPPIHRDPFDRLLVVRADLLGLVLVTADDAFDAYDVEVLRVG